MPTKFLRQDLPDKFKNNFRKVYDNPEYAWIFLKRKILQENLILVVATAHRVGSTWLYRMILELGYFLPGSNITPEEFDDNNTILLDRDGALEFLRNASGFVIFKSHSYPTLDKYPENIKFINIYRDPRDVIVSTCFYLSYLEEEKGGWGEQFSRLSEKERIKHFIQEGEFSLSRLEQWFRTPLAYKISYESLKKDPAEILKGISEYLKLPVNDKLIDKVIKRQSFKSISGRRPGDQKDESPIRKGITGDWRNYFDEECVLLFKTEKEGRWNNLLVQMGYEKTIDW